MLQRQVRYSMVLCCITLKCSVAHCSVVYHCMVSCNMCQTVLPQCLVVCPTLETCIALVVRIGENVVSNQLHGKPAGPEPSVMKVKGTELQHALKKLLVESLGVYGAPYENDMMPIDSDYLDIGPDHMQGIMAEHLYGRAATIFGGSNEIQRNIVARMLLKP